jgi:hypothetical protein
MPIWFVSWPTLQQAVRDGELTVTELSSLLPRKGSASFYTENIYPPQGSEVSGFMAFASGKLEDGTEFRFNAATTSFETLCCSSDHQTQHVDIEFNAIPEPSCIALLLLGLVGLARYRGHRRFP